MIRYALKCPGCSHVFAARVGADSTEGTKFYLSCPSCALPIRAKARGMGPEDFSVEFECEVLDLSAVTDNVILTANPFLPARRHSDTSKPGAFGMVALVQVLGTEILPYFGYMGSARAVIAEQWQPIRRIFEYYLEENWDHFDRTVNTLFDGVESIEGVDWPTGSTTHERATRAYTAVQLLTGELVLPSAALHDFWLNYSEIHLRALDVQEFVDLLKADHESGLLMQLERSMFDLIGLFVQRHEMWAMGGIRRFVRADRINLLQELELARDEFGGVRDLYQQTFESICKALRFLVAARNSAERQNPNDFGIHHPDSVPTRQRPHNMRDFDRLSNAYRIAYVKLTPEWEGLTGTLNSQERNSIGHAAARHDLRTGLVISPGYPDGITYLSFLGRVYDLFESLAMMMHTVRFARVASSPDFPDR